MTGPVEWAVLIFIVTLILGAGSIAWAVRGYVSGVVTKLEIAQASFDKDIRHLKGNFQQHGNILDETRDDVIGMKKDIERLSKIVNGTHHR